VLDAMDQEVVNAMQAAPVAADAAGLWYGALCATYETGAEEWEGFAEELRRRASAVSLDADDFIGYLNDQPSDPLDTVRKLCENGPDWITAQHTELFAEAEAEEADTGDDYDEKVWFAFLAENGAAWNGDEANWTAFVEWFQYEAGQAGLGTPAHEFVDYVTGKPDRAAAFAEFGITVAAEQMAEQTAEERSQDTSAFPALSEGDSGEWVAYLDQMLTAHGF
jgi:hypothetical protein